MVFICCLAATVLSQSKGVKLIEVKDGNNFVFPVLEEKSSNNCKRINRHLQLLLLKKIIQPNKKKCFDFIKPGNDDENICRRKLSYSVKTNSSICISFQFEEETCLKQPFLIRRFISFDLSTGETIGLQDLFSVEGFKIFQQLASKRSYESLMSWVKLNQPGSLEDFNYIEQGLKEDSCSDFYINNNSICVDRRKYFNSSIDVNKLLNTVTLFHFDEIKSLLNEYGKLLLTNKKMPAYFKPFFYLQPDGISKLYEGKSEEGCDVIFIIAKKNGGQSYECVYLNSCIRSDGFWFYGENKSMIKGTVPGKVFLIHSKNNIPNYFLSFDLSNSMNVKGELNDNRQQKSFQFTVNRK